MAWEFPREPLDKRPPPRTMAAVHPSRPSPHSRLRSSSDPFIDPSSKQPRPPPPPPKAISSSRMPAPVSKPSRDINNGDITEAVRDTVTVRGNTDYPARTRVARSQTAMYVVFRHPCPMPPLIRIPFPETQHQTVAYDPVVAGHILKTLLL